MNMRRLILSCCAAVFAVLTLVPMNASAASQQVKITEPFVNVYERLDPKSNVLVMAKKGDRFDLIYEGPLWYQVKVKDQIGWIERKAGQVVEGRNLISLIASILVICGLLAGTIIFVARRINKQKTA
jgi:hypothetical protein